MIEHMFYGEEEQAGSVHASVSVAQQALDGLAGVDVDAVDGRVLMDTVLALEGCVAGWMLRLLGCWVDWMSTG
ncbi:MAG: hypothetical protein R2716_12425 [Microthrixaceae bacterium]